MKGNKPEEPKKNSMKKSFSLMGRFFPYLRKHLGTEALVLCCVAVTAACDIALPLIVREITNAGVEDIASLTLKRILLICLFYIAFKGVACIASYCQAYFGHVMGIKIENRMREDMFDHLQKLSFTFFDNTKVGQLMSRMTSDLFDIAEWAHHFPEMVFNTVIKFFASFFIQ